MRRPSSTWVILDEREDSINDSVFIVGMDSIADPNYNSFTIVDYPAAYHGNAAASRLRTAILKLKSGRSSYGSAVEEGRILDFSVASPNNDDVNGCVSAPANLRFVKTVLFPKAVMRKRGGIMTPRFLHFRGHSSFHFSFNTCNRGVSCCNVPCVATKDIEATAYLSGTGLHTGNRVNLAILPAPENTGSFSAERIWRVSRRLRRRSRTSWRPAAPLLWVRVTSVFIRSSTFWGPFGYGNQ
jgi:hypothetical protein